MFCNTSALIWKQCLISKLTIAQRIVSLQSGNSILLWKSGFMNHSTSILTPVIDLCTHESWYLINNAIAILDHKDNWEQELLYWIFLQRINCWENGEICSFKIHNFHAYVVNLQQVLRTKVHRFRYICWQSEYYRISTVQCIFLIVLIILVLI